MSKVESISKIRDEAIIDVLASCANLDSFVVAGLDEDGLLHVAHSGIPYPILVYLLSESLYSIQAGDVEVE